MNPAVATKGWRARLEQALADNLGVGDPETKELSRLSGEWETCAIGENIEILKKKGYPFIPFDVGDCPRTTLGKRISNPASNLGLEFDRAVGHAHWEGALRILDKIEALPTLDEYLSEAKL